MFDHQRCEGVLYLKSTEISILSPVRKLIILVVIAIFSIILCYAFLFYQSGKHKYEDNVIINVFGKQRMLTQMIAKDASDLYALVQALQVGNTFESKEVVENKIVITKNNLSKARADFTKTLSSMHSGSLDYAANNINIGRSIEKSTQQLENLDKIWANFDNAISVLLKSTIINKDMANAVIYINDNNVELLKYCDVITQTVVEDSVQTTKRNENISLVLVVLSFIIIVFSLYNLSKYIILPINELYKGISEIGVSWQNKKTSIPTRQELIPVVSEISDIFKKISKLISLIENINRNSSFPETLKFIYDTFASFIPYTYIGIALVKKDKKVLEAFYGISDDTINGLPHNLMGKTVQIKDTSLGKLIASGDARIINDLEEYTANKPLTDYNRVILEAGIRSSITLPLKVSNEPIGVIFFSSNKKNVYNDEHVKFLETLVNSIAISFDKNIFVNDLLYSNILALVKLAEARDEDTGEHLERMKTYSRAITQFLYESSTYKDKINPEYIDKIERFSPMHDIGKVGIRDGILLKPGKLTFDEFKEMKKHPSYGAEVLRTAESNISRKGKSLFILGIEITEGHHEKWDGSGYPYGKSGQDIPLSARIVAVADVFDALTSRRPYKEPYTFEESYNIIVEGSGKHFDPEIVKAFVTNKDRIVGIYKKFKLF